MTTYTEEQKKQIKALVCRMLDRNEDAGCIEIAEVENEGTEPLVKRNSFFISISKIGKRETR